MVTDTQIRTVVLLTFLQSFCHCTMSMGSELASEKKLVKHLLGTYAQVGVNGRPAYNTTDPVTVSINFGLIELREFDIPNQELVMVSWTALEWDDDLLRWDPSEYGSVTDITTDVSNIWNPDVILSNALSKPESIHETNTHISNDGHVTWVSTNKYHFYCKISEDQFEDDQFTCSLKFASWSMGDNQMELKNKKDRFDTEYFVRNRDWEVYKNNAAQSTEDLPWANSATSVVTYEFTLRRRVKVNQEEDDISSASKVKVASLVMALLVGLTCIL